MHKEQRIINTQMQPITNDIKDGKPRLVKFRDNIYPEMRDNRPDLKGFNGIYAVLRHPGLADDGFDIGWNFAAPVGHGGFPDEWLEGWYPLPDA